METNYISSGCKPGHTVLGPAVMEWNGMERSIVNRPLHMRTTDSQMNSLRIRLRNAPEATNCISRCVHRNLSSFQCENHSNFSTSAFNTVESGRQPPTR